MVTVFGDQRSGNCLKVKWILEYRGVSYDWIDVDVFAGETRTPDFLAHNPFGQVPVVDLGDGRHLAQSNAIVLHFARGTDLIPDEPFDKAKMLEWLFWEQYSHEPYIAVRRFHLFFAKADPASLDPKLLEKGNQALSHLERALSDTPFLTGEKVSAADLCLIAYTRLANEGGFDLDDYPAVLDWVRRTEDTLKIS